MRALFYSSSYKPVELLAKWNLVFLMDVIYVGRRVAMFQAPLSLGGYQEVPSPVGT